MNSKQMPDYALNRRSMLAASAVGLLSASRTRGSNAVPGFRVNDVRVISLQSDRYHGWPTLARRRTGELVLVCSGGRRSHVCPFGRVEFMQSFDDGQHWTFSRTIVDGPIDDRDAGITETAAGTLLVSTFTSLAYIPGMRKAEAAAAANDRAVDTELEKSPAAHRRLPEGEHEKHLGCWLLRSEDGGVTWSAAYRVPVNSPHGPVSLSDGRLLYAGVDLWGSGRRIGVCISEDDGLTWQWLADIPPRSGDVTADYHEFHAVEAADGRLIVQIRNHNANNKGETLQTHSTDGGKTWAEPYSIGVWGLPSHLLRLSDDRLLMTYGHRRNPLGNQARLSTDHGQTWSAPMIISGDGTSGDLGYPSTVEIRPGQFVTVWYERLKENPFAQLRMARWELS
ncbi:MAG: exo-alpha-sialidase [Planctomycetaceae bacterium]|nr:exo-alpha-sialidase [Planctomycetaceae bacterium]